MLGRRELMRLGAYAAAGSHFGVRLGTTADTWAQEPARRLTFEVASIHPSRPGESSGYIKPMSGGLGYSVRNMPVKLMISLMYKVPMRQIAGSPDWLSSERYDVEAKADQAYGLEDLQMMFRNLLADRLSLRFHREWRDGNVYALTVDKAGLKMKPDTSPQNFEIPVTFAANGSLVGKRVDLRYLCWMLGQALQNDERPVIDQTGLTGFYDFQLAFAPVLRPGQTPPETASDQPSLFDAVRDQLGLRLQALRGPVESLVIEHVERPSDN